jgi:hypothetical protein
MKEILNLGISCFLIGLFYYLFLRQLILELCF